MAVVIEREPDDLRDPAPQRDGVSALAAFTHSTQLILLYLVYVLLNHLFLRCGRFRVFDHTEFNSEVVRRADVDKTDWQLRLVEV